MSSSRNDNMHPPSSSTTTNKSKAKSSSSFGFKRGFLTTNSLSSSPSSSSPPSSMSRTTTVLSQLGLDTASTMPNEKAASATASAATAFAPPSPPSAEKPRDLCPICCYALPEAAMKSRYKSCCGEMICMGCLYGQHRTLVLGTGVKMPLKGSKEEEQEFERMCYSKIPMLCPFCRAKEPYNNTEILKRLYKQIEKHNDPTAMNVVGWWSMKGIEGLPQNLKKAEKLFKRSFDLGNIDVAHLLKQLYNKYIPDQVLVMEYLEEGTRRGNACCMMDLANHTLQSGNVKEATRLVIMSARLGLDKAMNKLMVYYRNGLLSKEDLATTLRAHKAANDEVNNGPIEYAMRYRKFINKKRSEHPEQQFDGN